MCAAYHKGRSNNLTGMPSPSFSAISCVFLGGSVTLMPETIIVLGFVPAGKPATIQRSVTSAVRGIDLQDLLSSCVAVSL